MAGVPSEQELEAAHCWEADDRVPRDPAMTAFRRVTRWHHARWREAKGHPIGTQPIAPKAGARSRLVGSRLPLEFARETGATFVTPNALAAARARASVVEPHQTVDHQRVWADLLWSPTLAYNLFGDLAADHALADRVVHQWWPDAPGTVCDVRFAHSPGRLDTSYLGSLRAFDVVIVLDLGGDTRAAVAVDTNYHERSHREIARPELMWRYREIVARSGIFVPDAVEQIDHSDIVVMWLEHLLLHSMLQHESGSWAWGRYVVVHPEGNLHLVDMVARYRAALAHDETFASVTLEALLDSKALPAASVAALRDRYVPD